MVQSGRFLHGTGQGFESLSDHFFSACFQVDNHVWPFWVKIVYNGEFPLTRVFSPMPKRREQAWPPKIHVYKGYARTNWGGVWYHLGLAGSTEANAAYSRLINIWRTDPYHDPDKPELTVRELCQAYLAAKPYPPGRQRQYGRAVTLFAAAHPKVTVEDFGPLMLAAWQRGLIETRDDAGDLVYTRQYVGMLVRIVRAVWKWGVATERVQVEKWQSLLTVRGCRADQGKPGRKVSAVDDRELSKLLPHLPRAARGLVQLLRLTGARPSELFALRPSDVCRSAATWTYTPATHKTSAKGKERVIYFGPRARDVLAEFETGDAPYFAHVGGGIYNGPSLLHAITRACRRAGIVPMTSYQLRHSRLTEVRAAVGIEGAAAVGGHARLNTTEIYSQARHDLAAKVAAESG